MSKLCANLFKISDVVSGGVFGISLLAALLALIVPPVSLVVATIIHSLNLGGWGFLYGIAFIAFTYLTFRHHITSLVGHSILFTLLLFSGSGFPFFYTVLFLVYLTPYVVVYLEAKKT